MPDIFSRVSSTSEPIQHIPGMGPLPTHVQEGGLAGTGRAHDGREVARLEGAGQVMEHLEQGDLYNQNYSGHD
jgi:hypothetical protein